MLRHRYYQKLEKARHIKGQIHLGAVQRILPGKGGKALDKCTRDVLFSLPLFNPTYLSLSQRIPYPC
jgi:hypothetical protein